ncbi:MAG: hypothetical protein JO045_24465 [Mycobacterium sp.]|nr:hypothetical protein [Mycobacterium sp.]
MRTPSAQTLEELDTLHAVRKFMTTDVAPILFEPAAQGWRWRRTAASSPSSPHLSKRCGDAAGAAYAPALGLPPSGDNHAPLRAPPLRSPRLTPVPLLAGRACVGRSPPPSSAIPRSIPAHTRSMSDAVS